MKFRINREHFFTGLQQVMNIVSSRATMPILSNVLIEAENGRILLTTTNIDLGIRCAIKAEVSAPGSVTLPVRKLATIVKALPNSEVDVDASSGSQAKITSGGSNFRIMGIQASEFPPLPDFADKHAYKLEQEVLGSMLKSVQYAQSQDENRFILNGVFFNFADGKLTLVATDGRRLALTATPVDMGEDSEGKLILPAKTVQELGHLLGKGDSVQISFNERQVAFDIRISDKAAESTGLTENIYLVSRVVEGNYPNYRQVIPQETAQRIKVERELLLDCVQRAALVTSDKSISVTVKIADNLLEITGSSPEYGDSHESMAVAYDGPEVRVAFNPAYMMDPLKALADDQVYFEFKDEHSPGVFKTLESFLCVIMPLRL